MKQTVQKPNYGFNQQELELAQGELKVALIFCGLFFSGILAGQVEARH